MGWKEIPLEVKMKEMIFLPTLTTNRLFHQNDLKIERCLSAICMLCLLPSFSVGIKVLRAIRESPERVWTSQVVHTDGHGQLTSDVGAVADGEEAKVRDDIVEGRSVYDTRGEVAEQEHDIDEVREGQGLLIWRRERVRVQVLLRRRNKHLERVGMDAIYAGALVVLREQARLARLDLVRVAGDKLRLVALPCVQHLHRDAVDEDCGVVVSRQHSHNVSTGALGKRHQEEGRPPSVRGRQHFDEVVAGSPTCRNVQARSTRENGNRLVRLDQRARKILAEGVAQQLIHIQGVEDNTVWDSHTAAARRRAGRDGDRGVVLGRDERKERSSTGVEGPGGIPKRDVLGAKHVPGQCQVGVGRELALTEAIHDDVARG
eukprot:scaffold703_cov245-Pinguiococcus_pyrenoidosus.AAC.12